MEVFNSDHGSNILGCGNLYTAGSQIFKTKEFTWFSKVKYFQWGFFKKPNPNLTLNFKTQTQPKPKIFRKTQP
jgi:hypothetical protein